jgi:hypothetical protein
MKLNKKLAFASADIFGGGSSPDLYFDPKDISSLPSDIGINIQIYQGYQLHQFILEKPHMPTKFVLFGEFLHDLKQEQL